MASRFRTSNSRSQFGARTDTISLGQLGMPDSRFSDLLLLRCRSGDSRLLVLVFAAGCGRSGLYPVKGKVVFPDGTPLTAGTVEFGPVTRRLAGPSRRDQSRWHLSREHLCRGRRRSARKVSRADHAAGAVGPRPAAAASLRPPFFQFPDIGLGIHGQSGQERVLYDHG